VVIDLEMGLPIPVTRAPTLQMKSRANAPKVRARDGFSANLAFHHNPSEPLPSPPPLYLTRPASQALPLMMDYPPQYSEEDAIQPFRSGWNSSSPTIVMACR